MSQRIPLLLQLLDANPADGFALFALAKEYEGQGDAQQALAYYRRLREQDPAYVGLYYHLGKLYEQLGQPDAALEAYRAGMDVARGAGDGHSLRELQGAYLQAGGDFDEE